MKTLLQCRRNYVLALCFAFLCLGNVKAQIVGTKTIGGTSPDYATISAAISDLNTFGAGSGGVRFLVAAGHREVSSNLILSVSGNIFDSIIFQKNGAGPNPLITAAPGSGYKDGIIILDGADYVLFDGIDVKDTVSNLTSATQMEWGFAVLKSALSNGSDYITIKNCNVSLQKANLRSTGIFAANHTYLDTATLQTAGGHMGLKLINNNISNSYNGIAVFGSPFGYDSLVQIMRNNITNFGGGIDPARGINVYAQNNAWILDNTIDGGQLTKGALTGILTQTGTGNVSIQNNSIHLSSDSVYQTIAISNNMGTAASVINISGNNISNSTVSGNFTGIITSILSNTLLITGDSIYNIALKPNSTFEGVNCALAFPNKDLCRITGNYIGQISNGGTVRAVFSRANGIAIDSNTFTGFSGIVVTGIYAASSSYAVGGIIEMAGNTIANMTATDGFNYLAGIDANGDILNIFRNNIHGLRSGFSVFGIFSKQAVQNIYQNKIYDLNSTSTRDDYGDGMSNSGVIGIMSSFGSRNIHNNLISKLNAPASSWGNDVVGITIDAGSATSIYYNTIYLDAKATSGNFGSAVIYISSYTSSFTFRNNVFVNTSQTAGGGIAAIYRFLDAGAFTNFNTASNNNLLYPGAPASNRYFLFGGGSSDNNFINYKQHVGPNRDSLSYTQMPVFMDTTGNSPNFLRIDTAYASYIESGAAHITAYTKDFNDDNARLAASYPLPGQVNGGGLKPDMGAYEGDYKSFPPVTFASDSTMQLAGFAYRNVPRQGILGIRIVTTGAVSPLSVSSFSLGVGATTNVADISNARIYYTMGRGVMDTTRFFGSGIPAPGSFPVNGNIQLLTDTNYFWLTYDVAAGATPGNNIDAVLNSFTLSSGTYIATYPDPAGYKTIPTPIAGTYTVGAAGQFTTLTNAITALNLYGISDTVTFSLIDSLYNQARGEVFPLTINAVPGASFSDSVFIRPAAGVNAQIVSGGSAVFILNGSDYIRIDGSNNQSDSRNLTLTATSGTGIWMQNDIAGDSCTNNVFKNLIITAGNIGIGSGASSISTSSVGVKHNSNGILNCKINAAIMSIYLKGSSATVLSKNNYIIGNEILTSGVLVSYEDNIQIRQNKIKDITASSFGLSLGIATFSSYTPTGLMVTNARISGNEIGPVIRANAASVGLAVSPATAGTTIIDNNLIYGVNGSGTSTGRFVAGMYIGGGVGSSAKIYFNTVSLYGTSARSTPSSYAIAVGGTNPVIDLKNNIFSNTQTSSSTTSNTYAFGYNSATFVGLTASNNSFYTAGANAKFAVTGAIGINTAGTIRANLAALQSATLQNTGSLELNPELDTTVTAFYRPRVLQVITGATPVATFDLDKQGNTRNATNPSMGAFEVIPVLDDIGVANVKAANGELRVLVKNFGNNFVGSYNISYQIDNGTVVSQTFFGTLNPFDTLTAVITPFVIPNGIHAIKVFTTLPNGNADTTRYNDTVSAPLSYPLLGVYTVGGASPDYNRLDSAVHELIVRGVSGPVTFNIRTGTYPTQLNITSVAGVSETSKVVFTSEAGNADSVKITYDASNPIENYVVSLDDVQYITLQNVSLTATDSSYANVIQLANKASYNTIEGCKITTIITSNLSITAVGISSSSFSGNENLIKNNTFWNGAYGIQIYGTSNVPIGIFPPNKNSIEANTFNNGRAGAVYVSSLYNQKIKENTIRTSAAVSSSYNGLYIINCDSVLEIVGNKIKFNAPGYGIYMSGCDGTTFGYGLIANNEIALMNAGTRAGIYSSQSIRQRVLHNSVHIKANGTGIAAVYFEQDYLGGAPVSVFVDIVNNVFANSGGGLGMVVPHANGPLVSCDNNNIYSDGVALIQSSQYKNTFNGNYFRGLGDSYANLTAWKIATALAEDAHSVSYRPGFTNDTLLTPNPLDSASWSLNGRGIHLDSNLIKRDLNGLIRPAIPSQGVPDIGAYEFTPSSTPPMAKATPAAPAAGITQAFTFGEDTVAKIAWDVITPPSSIEIRQYTGASPQNISAPEHFMYSYIKVKMPPSVTKSYTITIPYHAEWIGTNNKLNLQLASFNASGGWSVDPTAVTDTVNNTFTSSPVFTSLSDFIYTGTDKTNPLPVKLFGLNARKSGKDVAVSWSTASEINSDYFEIERSYDNSTFEKAGQVKASGNSSKPAQYSFIDAAAFRANHQRIYYRLRSVDKDGRYTFSDAVVVNESAAQGQLLLVYPNPFSAEVFASVILKEATAVKVRVMDVTGKEVYYKEHNGDKGNMVIAIETEMLEKGIYFLSLDYGTAVELKKIIKY